MGYRSNVSITLKKADFEQLRAAFQRQAETRPEFSNGTLIDGFKKVANNAGFVTGFKEKNGFVVISWEDVEWAPEYCSQVDFIVKFIADHIREYQLVRVGERPGDVDYEDKATGWNMIRPWSTIESDADE